MQVRVISGEKGGCEYTPEERSMMVTVRQFCKTGVFPQFMHVVPQDVAQRFWSLERSYGKEWK